MTAHKYKLPHLFLCYHFKHNGAGYSKSNQVFYVCLYDYRVFFLPHYFFKMDYYSISDIYSVMRIRQPFSSYINNDILKRYKRNYAQHIITLMQYFVKLLMSYRYHPEARAAAQRFTEEKPVEHKL